MAKKSEKNENRKESLRKLKECLKKEPEETPKQKVKGAKNAKPSKQKAKEAYRAIEPFPMKYEEYILQLKKHAEKMKKWEIAKVMKVWVDVGFVFKPEDGVLLGYHLKNKIRDGVVDYCPIEEVNVYENHPKALTEKSNVWYFFTTSRPDEVKPGTYDQGHWVFGEKEDVFCQDEKVGVKQVVEYWEAARKTEYKIIEYQLDPAPDYTETRRWYVCKLVIDVHGGPQDSVLSEQKTETVGKMQETLEGVPDGNAVRKLLE